jgi:predicted O-methyltransferase YrrM
MRLKDAFRRWRLRLPEVEPSVVDPVFLPDELGPTPSAEAVIIGSHGVAASTTDTEAWILAVLSKSARVLFEFGTATGRTAYLWARNSPDDAAIFTLTLPPNARDEYEHAGTDSARDRRHALRESRFTRFRYHDTPVAPKVTQCFGDSKRFDESPYVGRCDLVFIDGSHAYSYVRSDTGKAMRMLAPGGLLLWHDYGRSPGVTRFLHEVHRECPLLHIRGTSLAAYRQPQI